MWTRPCWLSFTLNKSSNSLKLHWKGSSCEGFNISFHLWGAFWRGGLNEMAKLHKYRRTAPIYRLQKYAINMQVKAAFSLWKKSDYTYVNSLSIKSPKLIRYLNIYSKLHPKRGVKQNIIDNSSSSSYCQSSPILICSLREDISYRVHAGDHPLSWSFSTTQCNNLTWSWKFTFITDIIFSAIVGKCS